MNDFIETYVKSKMTNRNLILHSEEIFFFVEEISYLRKALV